MAGKERDRHRERKRWFKTKITKVTASISQYLNFNLIKIIQAWGSFKTQKPGKKGNQNGSVTQKKTNSVRVR
jgi:hypothetical protein